MVGCTEITYTLINFTQVYQKEYAMFYVPKEEEKSSKGQKDHRSKHRIC